MTTTTTNTETSPHPRRIARVRDVIADAYLQSHLDAGDPARGASLCPRLLGTDARAWERWIARFAATPRALPHLAPYVPTEHPRLANRRVRARAERVPPRPTRPRAFSRHGQGVGAHDILGAVDGIGGEAEDGGRRRDSPTLREALAELYLADGQRDRALRLHLELGRPSVLDFVQRHGLLPMCANAGGYARRRPDGERQHAREVGEVGSARAATMLADASFVKGALCVPAEVTVRALTEAVNAADVRGTRECLHLYLRELFARDPDAGERWHRAAGALRGVSPGGALKLFGEGHRVRSRRRSGRVRAPLVAQGAGVPAVTRRRRAEGAGRDRRRPEGCQVRRPVRQRSPAAKRGRFRRPARAGRVRRRTVGRGHIPRREGRRVRVPPSSGI